ncbi:MAG TPA: hypothetical protein VIS28_00960 [Nitrososphaeraceae archaeon]
MSTSINWTELVRDRKGVRTNDNKPCGNIIGNDEKNIIIEDGAMRQHIYKVPKSSIESYNGAELRLNISYDELETDEVKDDDKGMLESITESVKDKTQSLKKHID